MRRHSGYGFLLGWVLLLACAGTPAPSSYESTGSGEPQVLALGPRFRFPRPAKPPAPNKPLPAPKAEPPPAAAPASPSSSAAKPPAAQTPAPQKPAAANPTARGFLDPKLARSLFDQGMAEARKRFPHLHGKPKQKHHVHPKYLGGAEDGPTVDLDPAYHQLITNAFRQEARYGQGLLPELADLQEIMRRVYSRYPLPGIHFQP
ncbi:MAG TPA: hypothetical protein VFZ09_06190 [Archangium sp.]|uniref:hypothetical protein n=1 Tax=Archangium sp. TaxID=1872627 RepID=UPI002E3581A9|nr:hypothetical protein [Archangium sp.]HEX5745812.1 hypothetical protein [Archangium sp.]